MSREKFRSASVYCFSHRVYTRWMDNDVYHHVNNVIYYSWFDSAVNSFLMEKGLLNIENSQIVGLVVESSCRYGRPVSFPEPVTAMLRIAHLGTSSVRYEIGIFTDNMPGAAAEGHFVHVYVDRVSRRPTQLPLLWRETLQELMT
ncbi:MAG: acyl-CoA thioesterase [Sphingomonadaceae bacterium]